MGLSSRLQKNVHLHKQYFEYFEERVPYYFRLEVYLLLLKKFYRRKFSNIKKMREQYNES